MHFLKQVVVRIRYCTAAIFPGHTKRQWIRRSTIAVLALALAIFSVDHHRPTLQHAAAEVRAEAKARSDEFRGAWLTNIDSGVLFSAVQTSSGIQRLADLGINTLYPTVWNWGYSLYPSAVVDRAIGSRLDPHPGLANRDLLAEFVQSGHALGMDVIPWFEFGLMAPSYSELARQHPDWLTQRRDGSQVFMQGRHPRVWLNPLHPEVKTFFVDLIAEVISTYPVDGIQFDDHFSWPVEFGYDDYTLEQYRQSHAGRNPPDDPYTPEWMAWRADQLSELMGQIVAVVRRDRPNAIISLSPNPLPFAYEQYLQDWDVWQRRGWIDQLIVQVYRPTTSSFIQELDRLVASDVQAHSSVGIGILAGLKNRPLAPELIAEQTAAVWARGFDGVSFFFFEAMRNEAFRVLF